ncbi:MAG: YHS domain-containing protein [Pyrinomonadaceae bacterium]
MTTHKDPVCGMQIDEEDAAGQSDTNGQIFYFCSLHCKDKFDANPQDFVSD